MAQLSPKRESTGQLLRVNMAKEMQDLSNQGGQEIFTAARQPSKADAQSIQSNDTAHFRK